MTIFGGGIFGEWRDAVDGGKRKRRRRIPRSLCLPLRSNFAAARVSLLGFAIRHMQTRKPLPSASAAGKRRKAEDKDAKRGGGMESVASPPPPYLLPTAPRPFPPRNALSERRTMRVHGIKARNKAKSRGEAKDETKRYGARAFQGTTAKKYKRNAGKGGKKTRKERVEERERENEGGRERCSVARETVSGFVKSRAFG